VSHLALQTGDMSLGTMALLSMAVAIAAGVAMATLASAPADVVGGIVLLAAIAVFARTIMGFAAEPGGEGQRPARRR
jgi:hypothetical protein